SGGTSSGPDRTFTTQPDHPSVEAGVPSSLTQASGTLNATVNPNGGTVSDCHFEYGISVFYEASVPCSPLPGSGTSAVAVSACVEGVSPTSSYHFRIVASNEPGTGIGADPAFTTQKGESPPRVEGGAPFSLTQTSATLNATVNPNGDAVSDCR